MPEPLTIPPGSGDAILSYVRTKAREWTIAESLQRVTAALDDLTAIARAVPIARLEEQIPGSDWPALQCIRHITEINANTLHRVARAAAVGTLPRAGLPPFDEFTREEALERMIQIQGETAATLGDLEEDANPGLSWEHPLLGPLNWREWLLSIRVHCRDHGAQLQRMA